MPRQRTNPEAVATIHHDAVTQFGVAVTYGEDMRAIPTQTEFVYVVDHLNAAGQKVGQTVEHVAWGDIPAPAKRDIKALFAKVLAHAETKGYVGAGSDSNDPE